jgi:hypothetical protein
MLKIKIKFLILLLFFVIKREHILYIKIYRIKKEKNNDNSSLCKIIQSFYLHKRITVKINLSLMRSVRFKIHQLSHSRLNPFFFFQKDFSPQKSSCMTELL